ncbi:hypothetical protein HHL22_02485 [Hymenobacter sp. RP-2-7]|uniref:Uncharacterized protein n=1 Tax=Hymenobacter polaris TaxID=2682546 RepID=A0A7Y0FKT7_9BACT|nr:DUF6756 family protein [Hymenobacter polaris]NML64062.1 hypothetical protein [Hymenobacter polaris]
MRKALLNELDAARQLLQIPDADFRPLPFTTDWHKLEERIYHSFYHIEGKARPVWLWESFKHQTQSLQLKVLSLAILHHLIPLDETVWLMAYDGSNFFFYEGKVTVIQRIIPELTYIMDEYYLISKKFEWLLCENHHDILIGTGSFAIQQLRDFAQQFPELVISTYPS